MWREATTALVDHRVWLALGTAGLTGSVCFGLGTLIARRLGLLAASATSGETIGIGLGTGLMVAAVVWAALFSGGRSAFTPPAIAFTLAAVVGGRAPAGACGFDVPRPRAMLSRSNPRGWIAVAIVSAAFLIVVGLIHGSTLAPSPRDGVQPVESVDAAFYSVLGAELARTGTESLYAPSGFDDLPGLPSQTWYHWGEMWLAAAVIDVVGTEPIIARHYVVLPLLLLATVSLSGTVVRRLARTRSMAAFVLGGAACLFLAPVPLPIPGSHFEYWASGLAFGITQYGVAAVISLLILLRLCSPGALDIRRGQILFWAAVCGSLIAAHLILAAVALVALAGATFWRVGRGRPAGHDKLTGTRALLVLGAVSVCGIVTLVWGFATGHGIGASGAVAGVAPFAHEWRLALARIAVGAGLLLAIPVAWLAFRHEATSRPWIFATSTLALVGAAAVWGGRYADFNMFHSFFGPLAVFAPPIAAAAGLALWNEARRRRQHVIAAALFVVMGAQIALGAVITMTRLKVFGPISTVPLTVLEAIEELPSAAKLAYACRPTEEWAFWTPNLIAIHAHTGHPVIPMCFQADPFTRLITGEPSDPSLASPFFSDAPQRGLYPDVWARPSPTDITRFMELHSIGFIYSDEAHPNVIVPGAALVLSSSGVELARIP